MFTAIKKFSADHVPENLRLKMTELGNAIAPPSGGAGGSGASGPEERPELVPLRTLQKLAPPHADGTPEMRLLVVLQPPEELPPAPAPGGVYSPVVIVGKTVYVSGIGPLAPEATSHVGKVGAAEDKEHGVVGVEAGKAAARACALTMLAVLRAQLGSLNHIKRVVKVTGFVNSTADFTQQPEVMNGFSETMVEVFGARGKAARSAVGTASLPRGWAVEVEAIFELADGL
mmetsp:Transcript_6164/g.15716  ORF Transcript_6164/g.15716 Transcript_6164/m.15716 type:complete len:230 (+) Transcript_6164:967-1656(+)